MKKMKKDIQGQLYMDGFTVERNIKGEVKKIDFTTAQESSNTEVIVEVHTEILEFILKKYVENRTKKNKCLKFKVGEVHTTYTTRWEYNPHMIEEQFRIVKRTAEKIWVSGKVLEDRKTGKYYNYKDLIFTIQKDKDGNEFYDKAEVCGTLQELIYPIA